MNPIVIVGILAVTISAAAMMISFSSQQVRYSDDVSRISDMQAQRLAEEVSVRMGPDGVLHVENTGSVPIRIKEIRVLDDSGRITSRHVTDEAVPARHTGSMATSPEIDEAMLRIARGGQ